MHNQDDLRRRNLERRFNALAAAVKDHEARKAGNAIAAEDENLYRRLRQLCGERPTAEHDIA